MIKRCGPVAEPGIRNALAPRRRSHGLRVRFPSGPHIQDKKQGGSEGRRLLIVRKCDFKSRDTGANPAGGFLSSFFIE